MENKITFQYGNRKIGKLEKLSPLEAKLKIIELFETKNIINIEINYEEEPAHNNCTDSTR